MKPLAKVALTAAILKEQEPMDDNLTELLLSNKHQLTTRYYHNGDSLSSKTKPSSTKLQPSPLMESLLKKVAI